MKVVELASRMQRRQPRTLIMRASLLGVKPPVVRQIGVNDALSTAALGDILSVCFGLGTDQPTLREGVDGDECVHVLLQQPGDNILYSLGLWEIEVEVIDTYVRDDGTPQALCVGGSGSFHGREFDPSAINATLMGEETTAATLALAHPEVRSIIEASGIFDFVSLLQALDLSRASGVPNPHLMLPESGQARVGAWCVILAAASLAAEDEQEDIAVATMEAVTGHAWHIDQLRALCPATVTQLREIQDLAPFVQVEWFRAVLRSE